MTNRICIGCNKEITKNFIQINNGDDNVYLCEQCITGMYQSLGRARAVYRNSKMSPVYSHAFEQIKDMYLEILEDCSDCTHFNEFNYDCSRECLEKLADMRQELNNKEPLKNIFMPGVSFINELNRVIFKTNDTLTVPEYISLFEQKFDNDKNNFISSLIGTVGTLTDAIQDVFGKDIKDGKMIIMPVRRNDTDVFKGSGSVFKNVPKRDEFKDEQQKTLDLKMNTPKEIKKELDRYVIGQERAKKVLSVGIYNHYKRIINHKDVAKSNIMLVGSTGVGKTELARSVAKILDVPFVIADSTGLTEAGYVGKDVEDIIAALIEKAGGDIERAKHGIVYIDEIDKLARHADGRKDVSGEGVQQALLKLVEGSEIKLNLGDKNSPFSESVTINTSDILFICGGAFEGITMAEKKPERITPGFNSVTETPEASDRIDAKALIKFGMIPELIGRFPLIVQLEDLTQDDLKRILVEPEGSLVNQYKELLSIDDIELDFTEKALEYIANKAYENKTGARGLKSIIEDSILDLMYEIPDESDVRRVQVGISKGNLCFRKKAAETKEV